LWANRFDWFVVINTYVILIYKKTFLGSEQAIFCGVTSVRLSSSGKYNNEAVVSIRAADESDINLATLVCEV